MYLATKEPLANRKITGIGVTSIVLDVCHILTLRIAVRRDND